MGSISISQLQSMRYSTQIDVDSFDAKDIRKNGPYQDATSNQFAIYEEMCKEENSDDCHRSIKKAKELISQFENITVAQLAFDIFSVLSAIRVAKVVKRYVHIMASPRWSFFEDKVYQQGLRYHTLFSILDPSFDRSRVIMKVASTWEGLQAARRLKAKGIKTLGTTVFSMAQAILAAEAGCVTVSPFIHDLKVLMDDNCNDKPLLDLGPKAQQYFKNHGFPTEVKLCANQDRDEILATYKDVAAFTTMPEDLQAFSEQQATHDPMREVPSSPDNSTPDQKEYTNMYLENEARFRLDFAACDNGERQFRTMQSIFTFCDYQYKAEAFFEEMMGDRSDKQKSGAK